MDGQSAQQYAEALEANLQALLNRAKSGDYRAPPVKRVHIPKGDGKTTRPLGIPTFEDKVLQRAVAMALEAIYEQDFLPCSYGFRPGKSAHQALERLWKVLMEMKGGWVLEVDIRKFFDTLDHGQLREFVQQRVRDGVLLRLIDKWLKAGVLEEGQMTYPEEGTPQGGVISPLLANIYLHEVLDAWFKQEVQPRMKGRTELIRYADDFVICFEQQEDARRVTEVLPKRFEKYGLTLHPEKTQLIEFRPLGSGDKGRRPRSFDLLGFTHYWGKSRLGRPVVKRKTAASRLGRGLKKLAQWFRLNRHRPVEEQHHKLSQKLRGHYSYYGITGNFTALKAFTREAVQTWRKWLARRSQRGMSVKRLQQMLEKLPLPKPRVVHSIYTSQ